MKHSPVLMKPVAPTKAQVSIRRRYLGATVVTCVVLSIVGGTIHVLELGANRMQQMRGLAQINLENEADHIRAAGEDLFRTDAHEKRKTHLITYTIEEARSLAGLDEWKKLDTMVEIPGGDFIMGSDNVKTDDQNRPAHKVFVGKFEIGKYLVTNAQYARFVAEANHRPPINWVNGKIPPGLEFHPVTMISWYDAQDYAKWMNARLPTEAEWEKAAKGNTDNRWPWGDNMEPSRLNTYYNVGGTTRVDAYPQGASPYGVLDMAGNVQQWVEDDFLPYVGSTASNTLFQVKRADIPEDAAQRSMKVADFVETSVRYKVMRGGSWKSDPFSTSTYHRNFSSPNFTSDFYGFRIARSVN